MRRACSSEVLDFRFKKFWSIDSSHNHIFVKKVATVQFLEQESVSLRLIIEFLGDLILRMLEGITILDQ